MIYEMSVRGFTVDTSSGLDESIRGSYIGVIEKIPHLLELGVNAVELLPVFEFDELEFQVREEQKRGGKGRLERLGKSEKERRRGSR